MYKINYTQNGIPVSIQNGNMSIPIDEGNTDYRKFVEWNNKQLTPIDYTSSIPVTLSWRDVKGRRNQLLSESDWTQLPDAVLTLEEKSAWQNYRQKLRDIPQDYATPDDVIFPTPPNEVQ